MPLLVQPEPGPAVGRVEHGVTDPARQPVDTDRVPRQPDGGDRAARDERGDKPQGDPLGCPLRAKQVQRPSPSSSQQAFSGAFRVRGAPPLLHEGKRQRNAEDDHDQPQRQPLRDFKGQISLGMQELDQQLEADPADDDERAIHERRVALDHRQKTTDHESHRDDAQDPARQDDPELRRHGDSHENRINREDDVGQLDLYDGRPERCHARATAAPSGASGDRRRSGLPRSAGRPGTGDSRNRAIFTQARLMR